MDFFDLLDCLSFQYGLSHFGAGPATHVWFTVYNELLPAYNIIRSMSRAGTPTDNGAMEAINGWIKSELFTDFHITDNGNIKEDIDQYVKFFNEERPAGLQKQLGADEK